jgi:hypothetical protein
MFDRVYSIELDNELYRQAQRRFARDRHVTIIMGDSGRLLPELLNRIEEPSLFWLDGHYCGEGTAWTVEQTPILSELQAVLSHRCAQHVMLIDDARLFIGEEGYPTLDAVREFVAASRPKTVVEVSDDIIRIFPREDP